MVLFSTYCKIWVQMRKGLLQLLSLSDMYLCNHAFPVHYLIHELNYIVCYAVADF